MSLNNENNLDQAMVLIKPNNDLQKIICRFDLKESEISLYLVLFERQARRAKIAQEEWACHLLGLLPYEITQIIEYNPKRKLSISRWKLTNRFTSFFVVQIKFLL